MPGAIPPEINALIDPAIQGEERLLIAEKMALLPPEHRENVIVFDGDGTVYANRSSLKNEFATYDAVGDGVYVSRTGYSIYLPDDPRPDEFSTQAACASNSGSYYRVYSNPGAGPYSFFPTRYAYTQSHISLLDGSAITVDDPGEETLYAYMGGWANSGNGTAVDAGFQYNPNATEQNWSLFIKTDGTAQVSVEYAYRYAAGQYANLEFYVPSDGTVAIHASGIYARPDLAGSTSGERTLMATAPGWRSDGLYNVVKRVTSIAQAPQDLHSGSSVSDLQWLGYEIGLPPPSPNRHGWSRGDTDSSGGVCHYPDDSVVGVTPIGAHSEAVSISLTP